MKTVAVIGAGLSGATIARKLAERNIAVDVYESRSHVAGMCHTEREDGIMIHKYGPHIFHTDNREVWSFINRFGFFRPYIHRCKCVLDDEVYSLPINLHTINQFFGKAMSPSEAREFLNSQTEGIIEPKNMEEQAIKLVGSKMYAYFIEEYTMKQWDRHPRDLPAHIILRLPFRFNYDDNYFYHRFQGMPEDGYTKVVQRMLDHDNIRVFLNTPVDSFVKAGYDHTFWTGPLDAYFGYKYGRLAYRTLDFQFEKHQNDYQGVAVMNYANLQVPWTRIVEHKHFAPWENHDNTIIHKEFSRECGEKDTPFYPIRLVDEKEQLRQYEELAAKIRHVTFLGRLGSYRYIDMDVAIKEALAVASDFVV